MYDDHYGLTGRPFQLTPDPRFWFETATHRKAMAYLGYGLSQGEGFIVITGDVGAGKTTLVGHLMATIDPTRLHVIKIVSTQIEAEDLLRMVAAGLDVNSEGLTKAPLLGAIEQGLHAIARSGRRTLLIVDEAQALPIASLEELRMLSNFQTGGQALLQIFLLGQPEFRTRLHGSARLEQLRQRVIAVHHLDPMEPAEVAPYIQHRLSVVGASGRPQFTDAAYAALFAASAGVPRRLNQLAGRVLLFGALEQIDTIDEEAVAMVIADLAGDMPSATAAIAPVAGDASSAVAHEPPPPEAGQPHEAMPRPCPVPTRHVPAPSEALPIRFRIHATDAVPLETHGPDANDKPGPPAPLQAEPVGERATQDQLVARIAALEARIEEQDVALRRVLTLLVDWAEGAHAPVAVQFGGGSA